MNNLDFLNKQVGKPNNRNEGYYEKGLLNEKVITPFHTGMESPIGAVITPENKGDNPMQPIINEFQKTIITKMMEKKKDISNEDIKKHPHKFGVMEGGKFVSFIDKFNQHKGIQTDRVPDNSFGKKAKPKPKQKDMSILKGGE